MNPVTSAPSPTEIQPSRKSTGESLKRVLHVINGEHYSGAERVQDLLGMGLPEFGYDVAFACIKPDKFPAKRASQDVVLYETPMKFKFDLRAAKKLAQVVKFGGFDLLHAHTTRSAMIASVAARLADVPFVHHVHSPTSHDSTRWVANKINALLDRISLTGVSQLICVSESLAQHMGAQGYDPKLISVVPNGVPSREELKPRTAPNDRWVLGTVALFRPRKGVEILLEAMSILRNHGYDVRLRAVGPFETPDYERKMKALAKQHEVDELIEWTGFTTDVNAELEKMDVMVLPSLFGEGLPMVIIEAMAAGVPVVGTNVQGVPEVLRKGSGLVAAPGSAQELANCIRRLIRGEEDWKSIRQNAWERQSEHYSDHSMAAGVAAVYDRIACGDA